MITSPTRRVEVCNIISATKVQWDNVVRLHILDSDFTAAVSTATAESLIDLLAFGSSKFSALSHSSHSLIVT